MGIGVFILLELRFAIGGHQELLLLDQQVLGVVQLESSLFFESRRALLLARLLGWPEDRGHLAELDKRVLFFSEFREAFPALRATLRFSLRSLQALKLKHLRLPPSFILEMFLLFDKLVDVFLHDHEGTVGICHLYFGVPSIPAHARTLAAVSPIVFLICLLFFEFVHQLF